MGFGSLLRKRLMGWEYMWFDVVVGNFTGHEEVGPRLVMVLRRIMMMVECHGP